MHKVVTAKKRHGEFDGDEKNFRHKRLKDALVTSNVETVTDASGKRGDVNHATKENVVSTKSKLMKKMQTQVEVSADVNRSTVKSDSKKIKKLSADLADMKSQNTGLRKDSVTKKLMQSNATESTILENKSSVKKHKNKKQRKQGKKKRVAKNAGIESNDEGAAIERIACPQSLEYLRRWKTNRSEWSFQKVRQVWLLQHMYDEELVGDQDFVILLEYLAGLKGQARLLTVDKAEELIKTSDDTTDNDNSDKKTTDGAKFTDRQLDRLRQVIQLLS